MPPRTIDNLGVDVSARYAEDQKKLEGSFLKEARGVGRQAEIDVTIPYNPSEVELLFETGSHNIPWAGFIPPPLYGEQKKRLFTFQIVPSLGSDDKIEAQIERITSLVPPETLRSEEAYQSGEREEQRKKRRQWEEERDKEDKEREKKILITVLQMVENLDKNLVDINSRRGQYQRG